MDGGCTLAPGRGEQGADGGCTTARGRGEQGRRRAWPEERWNQLAAWPARRFLRGKRRGGRRQAGPLPSRAELHRQGPPSSRPESSTAADEIRRARGQTARELERRRRDPLRSRPESSCAAAKIRQAPQRRRAGRREGGSAPGRGRRSGGEQGGGRADRRRVGGTAAAWGEAGGLKKSAQSMEERREWNVPETIFF